MKELKESHPSKNAEFAVAYGVNGMPEFKWLVAHISKKGDAIIALVRRRIVQKTHKYSIEIPTSWDHVAKIDTKNSNQLWRDALAKEMKNVGVAFDMFEAHESVPVGWTKASCYLTWDVKIAFTRKAQWEKMDTGQRIS